MAYRSATITKAQIRLIHTLKGKLKWDDETYRQLLLDLTGASSSKGLSQANARLVIDAMQAELGEEPKVSPSSMMPTTADRLSQQQRTYIVNLWWQVCRASTPLQKRQALSAFLERQTGCSDLRFVPRSSGPALICAIKAMKQQKETING